MVRCIPIPGTQSVHLAMSEADVGEFEDPAQGDVEWEDGDADDECGLDEWDGPDLC